MLTQRLFLSEELKLHSLCSVAVGFGFAAGPTCCAFSGAGPLPDDSVGLCTTG